MEALVILDQNGIIQWASSTIFELLGYMPEELHGSEIFNILIKNGSKRTKQLFARVQEHPTRINEGLRQFAAKSGKTIPLYITVNSLPGKSMPDLLLVHLHFFESTNSEILSLVHEKAEIELAARKRTEHEIAAELHDHINPNLISAKLTLEYALQNPMKHLAELKKVASIINNAINEIRDLSHTIMKKSEKDFELHEVLNSLVQNLQNGSALRILLRYDRRLEYVLDTKQKVHLVRIIQEQVTNILMHTAADKILVSLQVTSGQIRLITKDNGRGFDPVQHHRGIGITNMLSRVNQLGGSMHINSKSGEGTTTRILFPVNNQPIPNP